MEKRSATDSGTGVVKLSEFHVSSSKEMDAAAIAINEQRFAPNIVNVVSADEFGSVVESNVGDFLKFLLGITIDTGGGDARTISMNGVPSDYVPVTIGGFALASARITAPRGSLVSEAPINAPTSAEGRRTV